MQLVNAQEKILRYWQASLAWRGVSPWCDGKNIGWLIQEASYLAGFSGWLGNCADALLDNVIHDRHEYPLDSPGVILPFNRMPKNNGLSINPPERKTVNA